MKNRENRSIIYIVFLFIFPAYLCGQENQSQELVKLLNSGEFFRSKELHQQICDTISPEIALYYKFRMAQYINKEDSAAIYLEKIFSDYPDVFGNETVNVYGILFDTYARLRNYRKGIYTYERMMKHLKENPYDIDKKELILWKDGTEGRLRYLKELTSHPPIELKRKKTNDFAKMEGYNRLILETKINGIKQKSLFDTGCDFYYIMNRQAAELIGIKCDLSEMKEGTINDAAMSTMQVTVDSIEIGNITLYNIPSIIFENNITEYVPDSVKNNREIMNAIDSTYLNSTSSTIGLPTMQLIGKMLIDYKSQKVTFPASDLNKYSPNEPNIFLYNFDLYTRLKLNSKNFTATIDTGSDDYIKIDSLFCEKHKNDIPIASIAKKEPFNMVMAHRIWNNIPYEIIYKPSIVFNNRKMRLPKEESIKTLSLQPIWYGEYFDGVIGYNFFKRIGKKVLLDLDNMRLEAIK